jgi:Uncharacterized protein conserved in bacteria|nr:DUF2000 family protein [uncultured Steroidobacter sp.]
MPEGQIQPTLNKVSIVLANGLACGQACNVTACIAAGLAAAKPALAGKPLVDAAGLRSVSSSHQAITILRAEPATMSALVLQLTGNAPPEDVVLSLFPAYAQTIHECGEYWNRHRWAAHANEVLLGIGMAGPKRWVSGLTGSLPLWR